MESDSPFEDEASHIKYEPYTSSIPNFLEATIEKKSDSDEERDLLAPEEEEKSKTVASPILARAVSDSPFFIPYFSIPRTEIVGDDNHISYVIELNDGARNEIILRRYSEFAVLQEKFKKMFPDLVSWLPPFPPKTLFKKSSKEFTDLRRMHLENWLKGIVKVDEFRESEEMAFFFNSFHITGGEKPPTKASLTLSYDNLPVSNKNSLTASSASSFWDGKRICIVGGSSGIGEEVAVQLAGKGNVKLTLVARREDRLRKVAERCRLFGNNITVTALVADVTDKEHCKSMINDAVTGMGGLDYLITTVGESMHFRFEDVLDEPFTEIMERITLINYYVPVRLAHHALPFLKLSKGHMIVLSSIAGKMGQPQGSFYSGAKHALHGFFNSLRSEVEDVSFTLVCPSFVNTESFSRRLNSSGDLVELRADKSKAMPVEECATKIIEAAKSKRNEVILDAGSSLGAAVQGIIPGVVSKTQGLDSQSPKLEKVNDMKRPRYQSFSL